MTQIEKPTAEDFAIAKEVAAFMETLNESEQTSDYLRNLGVYGRVGVVNEKGAGIVASAIGAYKRELAKKQEREDFKKSEYVGKVKDRIRVKVRLIGEYETNTDFGTMIIYRFISIAGEGSDTVPGNVFTWFASKRLVKEGTTSEHLMIQDRRFHEIGDELWLLGSVKKFDDYKGIKQTVLTRCDAVLSPEDNAAFIAKQKLEKKAAAKVAREAKKAATKAAESAPILNEESA